MRNEFEPIADTTVISRGKVTSVVLQGCGHLHVHMGAFTVRLDRSAFADLANTLKLAQRNLDLIEH